MKASRQLLHHVRRLRAVQLDEVQPCRRRSLRDIGTRRIHEDPDHTRRVVTGLIPDGAHDLAGARRDEVAGAGWIEDEPEQVCPRRRGAARILDVGDAANLHIGHPVRLPACNEPSHCGAGIRCPDQRCPDQHRVDADLGQTDDIVRCEDAALGHQDDAVGDSLRKRSVVPRSTSKVCRSRLLMPSRRRRDPQSAAQLRSVVGLHQGGHPQLVSQRLEVGELSVVQDGDDE